MNQSYLREKKQLQRLLVGLEPTFCILLSACLYFSSGSVIEFLTQVRIFFSTWLAFPLLDSAVLVVRIQVLNLLTALNSSQPKLANAANAASI